ncbi:hypothetical protein BJX62DRAFT_226477 [Aspergillus germanicus]
MLFDQTHDTPAVPDGDLNHYACGCLAKHNVVAVCLPDGEYGTNATANITSDIKRSFPQLRLCLLDDIRLGNIIISTPSGASVSVLPYNTVKTLKDGIFQINGYLYPPPCCIAACNDKYRHPGVGNNMLFMSDYAHSDPAKTESCNGCNNTKVQVQSPRGSAEPHIHYGLIASRNQVMKSAAPRDKLDAKYGIMCFKIEAASIRNAIPSLIIRGISNYCDSHKNKQ